MVPLFLSLVRLDIPVVYVCLHDIEAVKQLHSRAICIPDAVIYP